MSALHGSGISFDKSPGQTSAARPSASAMFSGSAVIVVSPCNTSQTLPKAISAPSSSAEVARPFATAAARPADTASSHELIAVSNSNVDEPNSTRQRPASATASLAASSSEPPAQATVPTSNPQMINARPMSDHRSSAAGWARFALASHDLRHPGLPSLFPPLRLWQTRCSAASYGHRVLTSARRLGKFVVDGVAANIARVAVMVPGYVVLGWALTESDVWAWQTATAWAGCGVTLLIGGYLAPAIKRLVVSKSGIELETHEQREFSERTGADLTTSEELAQIEAAGELPGAVDPVEVPEITSYARFVAASAALEQLLHPHDGPLAGCELHVYLWDDDRGGLVRDVFESTERARSERPWTPGVGVVGMAWRHGEVSIATGPAVADETYNLDSHQQSRHQDLAAVAATPITNTGDATIGVLSASCRDAGVDLSSDAARNELVAVATAVSRILVDLLGWFADRSAGN